MDMYDSRQEFLSLLWDTALKAETKQEQRAGWISHFHSMLSACVALDNELFINLKLYNLHF